MLSKEAIDRLIKLKPDACVKDAFEMNDVDVTRLLLVNIDERDANKKIALEIIKKL